MYSSWVRILVTCGHRSNANAQLTLVEVIDVNTCLINPCFKETNTGPELAAQKRPARWRNQTSRTRIKVSTAFRAFLVSAMSEVKFNQNKLALLCFAAGCLLSVRTTRSSEPLYIWRMKLHRRSSNRAMRTKRIFGRTFKYWNQFNTTFKLCGLPLISD